MPKRITIQVEEKSSYTYQMKVSLTRRRDDDSECVDYEEPHHYAECVDIAVKVYPI